MRICRADLLARERRKGGFMWSTGAQSAIAETIAALQLLVKHC